MCCLLSLYSRLTEIRSDPAYSSPRYLLVVAVMNYRMVNYRIVAADPYMKLPHYMTVYPAIENPYNEITVYKNTD